MYQPHEESNVFKWFRQNILGKIFFRIFFLIFVRVQNLQRTHARGTKEKYEYQMPEFGISPETTPQLSEDSEEERSTTPTPFLTEEKVII